MSSLLMPFDSTSALAEAGVFLRPVEHVHVLLGYRHWRYRYEEESSFAGRDIDLKVDGVLAGVELRF